MLKVSISDKEFAVVSYQTVDMYDESSIADAGKINIALKDLNNSTGWDGIDFSTAIAQDTSVFVWDMDFVLGWNNMLYTLSQENDTIIQALYGRQYMPYTGSLFGDASMGMVDTFDNKFIEKIKQTNGYGDIAHDFQIQKAITPNYFAD